MMATTHWGRKETIIFPPHSPIYSYGAVFLALVLTGCFVYLHFSFGQSALQQFYTPIYARTAVGGAFKKHSKYQLLYIGDGTKAGRLSVESDVQAGTTPAPGGKQIPLALSRSAAGQGLRALYRGPQQIYLDATLHEYLKKSVFAYQFSPQSNKKTIAPQQELRVLVATDVLSEGQNLQNAFIIVNYDLPWTIIRLIQRAGRVDRIGQKSDKILCYSFLPADGIETIINLRAKVRARLHANSEVVGTDESFFDDDKHNKIVADLYNEKAGLLDGEDDSEVDLVSYAYQIWQDAISADPTLKKTIEDMPNVVYTAKQHELAEPSTQGALGRVHTTLVE